VAAEILVWPVQLNVIVRLLPDYPFSPYLGAGPGFFLVWQTLKPAGMPDRGFRDSVFGFQALAGLEYRVGPGVVLLESRYQYVELSAPLVEGGVRGQVGGLGATLGYRYMF
jgi:opacity protein-like surface antigen